MNELKAEPGKVILELMDRPEAFGGRYTEQERQHLVGRVDIRGGRMIGIGVGRIRAINPSAPTTLKVGNIAVGEPNKGVSFRHNDGKRYLIYDIRDIRMTIGD